METRLSKIDLEGAWYREDLNKHDRLMNLLCTYHRVHLSQDEQLENYGDTLSWCLEHCKGKFRDMKNVDGTDWYFEFKEDAMLFTLRWT